MFADVARTQFNVDGTGVTVGVLSDSVSQYAGGLADSYKTGDLSASNPVNVIADGARAARPTKAGRCWRTSTTSRPAPTSRSPRPTPDELTFANNINALATTAKANIIVDDVSYPDEPMFQDGLVSQAIDTRDRAGRHLLQLGRQRGQ